jgi:hypothetical protein
MFKTRPPTEEELKRVRAQGFDGITEVGEWGWLAKRFFRLRYWLTLRALKKILGTEEESE